MLRSRQIQTSQNRNEKQIACIEVLSYFSSISYHLQHPTAPQIVAGIFFPQTQHSLFASTSHFHVHKSSRIGGFYCLYRNRISCDIAHKTVRSYEASWMIVETFTSFVAVPRKPIAETIGSLEESLYFERRGNQAFRSADAS